jgi:hypothetical protein
MSFFHSASAYWQALLSALEGKAADCAASILLQIHTLSLRSGWKVPHIRNAHVGAESAKWNLSDIQLYFASVDI